MDELRSILHVDMDAFFASVEQRDNPELRGKPVLVGHDGPRGVVATASYEARQFGCRSAQPIAVAKRLCPQATIVEPRHALYCRVSGDVFDIFESFTSQVEPLSIDEAFLDVTGSTRLHGSPREIATKIRDRIRRTLDLTASVGAAQNKFLAKLASDMNKPDGLTIVRPDEREAFIRHLPVERMWGIGPKTAVRLRRIGVRRFADFQTVSLEVLRRHVGTRADRLQQLARGMDNRPVVADREAKSVSQEQTFGTDLETPEDVRGVLMKQVDQVSIRLRRAGLRGRTAVLKIRSSDFKTISRSRTLEQPSNASLALRRVAGETFDHWADRSFFKVRLIGFGCTGLSTTDDQPGLFDPLTVEAREAKLDRIMDQINERFGGGAIHRADV